MSLKFDAAAQEALDLAKRSLPRGGELDTGTLLAALYFATDLRQDLPDLTGYFDEPTPRTESPGELPVAEPLQPVLGGLPTGAPVGARRLFETLIDSEPGREFLAAAGVEAGLVSQIKAALDHGTANESEGNWRSSDERQEVVKALSGYGRMLTAMDLPHKNIVGADDTIRSLVKALVGRKLKSVVLVGPAGTGKTAMVHEFARRLVNEDPSIPAMLRDRDVFELSPAYLRAGAGVVGEYEERLKALIEILKAHPKVVLFVDEVHSLLQSGMHVQSPWASANEEFKKVIGSGEIVLIGCTTLSEFRHYIQPDQALVRRLGQVRIEPPSAKDTVGMLAARRGRVEAHYGITIDDSLLERTVQLTEDYLLGDHQPAKSIKLLDEACAWCIVHDPPLTELTEHALVEALEDTVGEGVVRTEPLDIDDVKDRLTDRLVGQDELLADLAHAFVAGTGVFKSTKGPRGNFFFAGPTGVGKTQAALLLAEILGGGKDCLIRIDCNTLQGSGHDSRPSLNRLLGPPPGYVGYVRGEGGLLSKIRDIPEAIVLFDEVEKADPGVAKTLLQILDEGTTRDADDNLLDFRRSFLIFTSNAGVTYRGPAGRLGFRTGPDQASSSTAGKVSSVSKETVLEDLRDRGFPQEFLGRNVKWFIFSELGRKDIPIVIQRQLASLDEMAELHGYDLSWDPEIIDYLADQWEPRFGVRHLTTIVKNRITEQMSVADAQGELEGVTTIRLERADGDTSRITIAGATRERDHHTLIIRLA
jgi:ATP-dependent Clp protease ATP-binding subunit ClpA